jgi:hypothetical protein
MRTSYFHNPNLDPNDPRLVSIARWAPDGYRGGRPFKGRHCLKLAPPKTLKGLSREEFTRAYQAILDQFDPAKVYKHLGADAILLCWEPPGQFCHRRLVAEWLEVHLGIEVRELEGDERQGNLF